MADIKDVAPGDRLFIKTQPKKRSRVVTVKSVDREAGSFVTTEDEAIGDMSRVEGWDLAGDIFNIPKGRS
jgi:hypothetical protein